MIDSEAENADQVVEEALTTGLNTIDGASYEIMNSQKVGPTIADDIKTSAFWSIVFSLIVIFLYIVLRFRKWQYGLGAIVAIFHDVLVGARPLLPAVWSDAILAGDRPGL